MFEPGDKFIRFTKYGSVIIGEVKTLIPVNYIDLENRVTYTKLQIITTKGILLELDGSDGTIYKIDHFYSEEEVLKIQEKINKIKTLKDVRPKS